MTLRTVCGNPVSFGGPEMVIAVDEPHPSQSEELSAEFGHAWDIWRELLPGGAHGDWVARRLATCPTQRPAEELRAPTIDQLRDLLRQAEPSEQPGQHAVTETTTDDAAEVAAP